jgi:hypothetical protein
MKDLVNDCDAHKINALSKDLSAVNFRKARKPMKSSQLQLMLTNSGIT